MDCYRCDSEPDLCGTIREFKRRHAIGSMGNKRPQLLYRVPAIVHERDASIRKIVRKVRYANYIGHWGCRICRESHL